MQKIIPLAFLFCVLFNFVGNCELSAKCPKCKKPNSEQRLINAQKKSFAEQAKFEKNVRSLCGIINDQKAQNKLDLSDSQKQRLAALEIKVEQAHQNVNEFMPSRGMTPMQLEQFDQMKEAKRQDISLKAGYSIMQILSKEQVNGYGILLHSKK